MNAKNIVKIILNEVNKDYNKLYVNIVDFKDTMDKISAVNFDNIDSAESLDLYDKTIMRTVGDDGERNYLAFTYKSRIEKAFNNELAKTEKYNGTSNDILKKCEVVKNIFLRASNNKELSQYFNNDTLNNLFSNVIVCRNEETLKKHFLKNLKTIWK